LIFKAIPWKRKIWKFPLWVWTVILLLILIIGGTPSSNEGTTSQEGYSTAFHEMVHSTGHKSRLDRLEKTAFFGSEAYSKEELIAEIGAAALVNHVGLETAHSFRNNAAYVQNWLQVLRNDKRFIVSAAGKAEKAVNLILG